MATATIHGFTTPTSGDWPVGAGTAGYWIKDATEDGTSAASLPANVTSCAWNTPLPGVWHDTSGTVRQMALPGGGRNAYSWILQSYHNIFVATTSPVRIAIHGYSAGSYFSVNLQIKDTATNTAMATSSLVSASPTNCIWFDATIDGDVRIAFGSTNLRVQGVLFSASAVATPGRLIAYGRNGLVSV